MDKTRIAFIVGSTDIGGGNNVILSHAAYLQKQDFDVYIISLFPPAHSLLAPWHIALNSLPVLSIEEAKNQQFDLAIATWWATAYELPNLSAKQYMYFVQSIESWFVPDNKNELRRVIDATYLPLLPIITEATWIQHYLREIFSHEPFLVLNGIDKTLFNPDGVCFARREKGKLRVLIEGPIDVDFKNVPNTIKLVKRAAPDEIWLLTSSDISYYPGVDRIFSRIPIHEVPAIYRSCDVLVKLSYVEGMFGPPLEMFHCGGTAITYNITGHEEYMKNGLNSLILETGDEAGVVAAIKRLKTDAALLDSLKKGALHTSASWPDWDTSSSYFLDAVLKIMKMPPVSRSAIQEILDKKTAFTPFFINLIKRVVKKLFPKAKRINSKIKLWRVLISSYNKDYGKRTKKCSFSKEEIKALRQISTQQEINSYNKTEK